MLIVGKFPTQAHYNTLLHKPISQIPSKPIFSFSNRLNFHPVIKKSHNGLCFNALKTKKRGEIETDGPDDFDDGFFDDGFFDDDEFEGEEEEEEDEIMMPLGNMKKWVENKPRGFGEGKVYDTSVEDKLMEEIEQSRKAQLANLNKLKNMSPEKVKPSLKKEASVQGGFRVRLLNLPKKKNIHKDLRLAFKGVPGLLNIVQVVSGNEKTRDPVCKGLAFVDFKYQDEAQRFVQNFSGKAISFGKVEKQIKCEMMNPKKSNPAHDQSVVERNFTPEQAIHNSDIKIDVDIQTDVSPLDSSEESVPSEVDDDDYEESSGTLTTFNSDLAEKSEVREEIAHTSTSKPRRKPKTNEKNVTSKRTKDKIPKLNIPGSANRLKIREKEMLTGVFSKYGTSAASIVKEQSR